MAHWIKETEKQNSDLLLKHMPKDALKTFENVLLYIRKKVKVPTNQDRRLHNNKTTANIPYSNLTGRITKFEYVINKKLIQHPTDILDWHWTTPKKLKPILSVYSRQT